MSKLRRGEVAAPSKLTFGEVAEEYLAGLEASVAAGIARRGRLSATDSSLGLAALGRSTSNTTVGHTLAIRVVAVREEPRLGDGWNEG